MRCSEPTQITQYESVEWRRVFCDFSPTEWTLTYLFRGPGVGLNINADADGDAFTASITAAQSAALDAGDWQWQARMTNIADTDVNEIADSGNLIIKLGFDPDSTAAVELRSEAKQTYDAIRATLAGMASSDQLQFEVSTPAGTTRIWKMSRKELTDLLAVYAKIVRRENLRDRVNNGGSFIQPINVRSYEC